MNTTEDSFPDLFADIADTPEFASTFADSQTELGLLKALVHARKALDLNQDDIAEAIDVSQSVISDLERGNTAPRLPILLRYARAVQSQLTVHLNGQDVRRCLDSYSPVNRASGTVTSISSHDGYWSSSHSTVPTLAGLDWRVNNYG